MRVKKFGFLIVASLLLWVGVTYYLFVHRPSNRDENEGKLKSKSDAQLGLLESKIKEALTSNKLLLNQVKKQINQFKKQNLLIDKIRELNLQNVKNKNEVDVDKESYQFDNKVSIENQLSNDVENNLESDVKLVDEAQNISSIIINQDIKLKKMAEENLANGSPVIAVLVFSCNRVTVTRCIDQLIRWRPSKQQFPIIVSQDCSHQATTDVIRSYGDEVTLIQQPDQSDIPVPPKEKKFKGYFKIARHYGWALNQTFKRFGFKTAIIVEDDLDIAPDFFEYFLGTYALLQRDPTLWCISAWNDNGKTGLIDENQPQLLYRTDFFPGLGWMLTSTLWDELSVKWPTSYWDDWIRQPEQRKERACIRPELPRTKTFGKIGVSNGLFYEKHLKYIKLNEKFVSFTQKNLSYLLKDNYDVTFVKEVYESPVVSFQELRNGAIYSDGPVRIPYRTKDQYKKTAKMLGLMDDYRSGVPRTAYRGVVSFFYKDRRVFLAPHANWKNYDPTWS